MGGVGKGVHEQAVPRTQEADSVSGPADHGPPDDTGQSDQEHLAKIDRPVWRIRLRHHRGFFRLRLAANHISLAC